MKIPTWNSTVTLIRRIESKNSDGKTVVSFKRYAMTDCFWKASDNAQFNSETVFKLQNIVCRIPTGYQAPSIGDALFLGNSVTTPTSASELNALIESNYGKAFRVTNVYDNSGQRIPHYVAKG